ncbi:hypothetical protein Tco_0418898 [Tanacetum coccineum]
MLDSKRPILKMPPARSLKSSQYMDDHSQKWHDRASTRHRSSCEVCKGIHRTKECPLNDEGGTTEEVKYGELGKPFCLGIGLQLKSMVDHVRSLSSLPDDLIHKILFDDS